MQKSKLPQTADAVAAAAKNNCSESADFKDSF